MLKPSAMKKSMMKYGKSEQKLKLERSNDMIGAFMRTDTESYLSLIRSKIQQRCKSTRELLQMIRKTKNGNETKITPSEFRFILIKFGVILSQQIVDKVFNIFDTDRSGTMDYDEFGTWIMNSEILVSAQIEPKEVQEESLRRKMLACISNNPGFFATVNPQLNYCEFIAFVNFLPNTHLTDKEARALFVLLTHKRSPSSETIDTLMLRRWAHGEGYAAKSRADIDAAVPSLTEAIKMEFGTNRGIVKQCFMAYAGKGKVLIAFEEFRKCLLSQGHGLDINSARNLFLAFGGAGGYVDTAVVLAAVENATVVAKSHIETKPRTCNRTNELLREAMRKCYRELHKEFRLADLHETGFVTSEQMHSIISSVCLPLTHQDFRGVLKQLRADESCHRVNWHTFLMQYSPTRLQTFVSSNDVPQRPFTSSDVYRLASLESSGGASSQTHQDTALAKSLSNEAIVGQISSSLQPNTSSTSEVEPQQAPADEVEVEDQTCSDETTYKKTVAAVPDAAQIRSVWQAALTMCRAIDVAKTGNVRREQFLTALEKSDKKQRLSAEEKTVLADKFAVGVNKVNYIECFREYLSELASLSAIPSDNFTGYSHTFRRELKPRHPWEFDYKRELALFNPYIPHNKEKLTVLDFARAKSFPRLAQVKTDEEEITQLLAKYDAKIVNICKKCANSLLPIDAKYLEHEFRSCEGRAMRTGFIPSLSFQTVLASYCRGLLSTEMGALLRGFRNPDAEKEINYLAFLHVCGIMRDTSEDNKQSR